MRPERPCVRLHADAQLRVEAAAAQQGGDDQGLAQAGGGERTAATGDGREFGEATRGGELVRRRGAERAATAEAIAGGANARVTGAAQAELDQAQPQHQAPEQDALAPRQGMPGTPFRTEAGHAGGHRGAEGLC